MTETTIELNQKIQLYLVFNEHLIENIKKKILTAGYTVHTAAKNFFERF